MKLKTIRNEKVINNYIDEYGQILDTNVEIKKQTIVVESKEQFAYQYASVVGAISDLNGVDIKVLTYCSLNAGYNTNTITFVKPIFAEVASLFGISEGSVKNSLHRLVQKNILIRVHTSLYRVNPKYYWRGEGSERNKTMKYILEIECPECGE